MTLDDQAPLEGPDEQFGVREPDPKTLIAFFKGMEFNTLTQRVADKSGIDARQVSADAKFSAGPPSPTRLPVGR